MRWLEMAEVLQKLGHALIRTSSSRFDDNINDLERDASDADSTQSRYDSKENLLEDRSTDSPPGTVDLMRFDSGTTRFEQDYCSEQFKGHSHTEWLSFYMFSVDFQVFWVNLGLFGPDLDHIRSNRPNEVNSGLARSIRA